MSDNLLHSIDVDLDDLPPSTVDLDAALRTGRRRERRSRALRVSAVAAVVLVSVAGVALAATRPPDPGPIQPSPSPSISSAPWACALVPSPPRIAAIDPTGRFIAVLPPYLSGRPPTLSMDGGPPREMTGVPLDRPVPFAVNAAGTVVGFSGVDGDLFKKVGWVYRDGRVELLPLPPGAAWVVPLTINARGDIAGEVHDGPGGSAGGAFWPASAPGTVQILKADGKPFGTHLLADDGPMIGSAGGQAVVRRPDGTSISFPARTGLAGISGDWVFGTDLEVPDGMGGFGQRGFRYNIRTGVREELGAFLPRFALADGGAAGETGPGDGPPGVWHDGTVVALPTPPHARRVEVTYGGGRTIAGLMTRDDGTDTALVWRC